MLQRPYRLAGLMAVTLTTLMVSGAGRTAVRAKEIHLPNECRADCVSRARLPCPEALFRCCRTTM
jgi:hypothetical protein